MVSTAARRNLEAHILGERNRDMVALMAPLADVPSDVVSDHCAIEYSGAYPLHHGMVVVVHFEGDRVKSENTCFAKTSRLAVAATADYSAVPGAYRLDA